LILAIMPFGAGFGAEGGGGLAEEGAGVDDVVDVDVLGDGETAGDGVDVIDGAGGAAMGDMGTETDEGSKDRPQCEQKRELG
jgi:hypothetical protein